MSSPKRGAKAIEKLTFTYDENEIKYLDFNKVFTDKERIKYKETFKFCDKEAKGLVKKEGFILIQFQQFQIQTELPFMLRALGLLVSTYEVRELVRMMDQSGSNTITLRQFHTAIFLFREKQPVKEEIEHSLCIFDETQTGVLDVSEMKERIMTMGDIVTEKEYESVFNDVQVTKGKVKIKDLVNILMIQPKPN